MIRKTLSRLCIFFGLLGCLAGLGVLVLLWLAQGRVVDANNRVFGYAIDSVEVMQQRFNQTALAVDDLSASSTRLKEILLEPETEFAVMSEITGQMELGLEKARAWIDACDSTLAILEQGLQVCDSLGVSLPSEEIETLAEQFAERRVELQDLIQPIARLVDVSNDADVEPAERVKTITPVLAKLLVDLDAVSSKFDGMADRLDLLKPVLLDMQSSVQFYIRAGAGLLAFLIAWLTAGQLALAWLGWSGLRFKAEN